MFFCLFVLLSCLQLVSEWRTVFFLTSGTCVFGAVFYSIFGSGELQPWADQTSKLFACQQRPNISDHHDHHYGYFDRGHRKKFGYAGSYWRRQQGRKRRENLTLMRISIQLVSIFAFAVAVPYRNVRKMAHYSCEQ